MASADDETMTIQNRSSIREDDRRDDDIDDGSDYHHHQPQPHNLSRLSMCTGNPTYFVEGGGDDGDGIRMFMSRLSIESSDDDADGEISDNEKEGKGEISVGVGVGVGVGFSSSDSEDHKEPRRCYSLPATPPRRRRNPSKWVAYRQHLTGMKEYASENEVQNMVMRRRRRMRGRRLVQERGRSWDYGNSIGNYDEKNKNDEETMRMEMGGWNKYCICNSSSSFSGESESGGGVMVITRPKGGRRSLCMDLEEVKACRDLGFELEHERMIETMPMRGRVSVSVSASTTSSRGNSPIANWRISSPGDDPRDVKARLKVWAQAVALASTSPHGC